MKPKRPDIASLPAHLSSDKRTRQGSAHSYFAAASELVNLVQRCRCGAIAAEQGVVDDDGVPADFAHHRRDDFPDDGRAQEQRELTPMNSARIHEAVERVPV